MSPTNKKKQMREREREEEEEEEEEEEVKPSFTSVSKLASQKRNLLT